MGTAILPAQDYLVSYKANQNRHSSGRVFHQSNLLQSGHAAVRANRSLRGRSPDFERRTTDPQVPPRFNDFERRKWNPQSDFAFASSETVSSGNLPNRAWQSQNFRSTERILRPMSTPPELHVGGSAPYDKSLSIIYAQQSYLQQSLSSRQYFEDAKHSVYNHEAKGRRFSQQGKHVVMEKVTILKRGETFKAKETDKKSQIREKLPLSESNLDARISNPKKNKPVWASRNASSNTPGDVNQKTNQVAWPAKPKVVDNSVLVTSTERLGPDPSVLPKEGSGILQCIAAAMKSTDITTGNGNSGTLKDSAMSDGVDLLLAESPSDSGYLSGSSPVFEMEKWAGPAYSNSPPPSSLPFPKFSMQQVRSIASDLIDASEGAKNADQDLQTQKKVQCCNNGSSVQYGFDISATQDLRRLLGLN